MIFDISLNNFRSYTQDVFEFGDKVNIIVGPNASGKTNLLEAILMICRGSSYRVKDVDVVQFDKPWARVEADTDTGRRSITIEKKELGLDKKYTVDGVLYRRITMSKTIPVVVFEPDHLRLLSGGPERRREYVDILLEQITPGYSKLRRDYRRTLAQRNKLLKQPSSSNDFFVWNVQLSEMGGKIAQYRERLLQEMNKQVPGLYKELAQSSTAVSLHYASSLDIDNYSTQLLQKLESGLATDRLRGFTNYGPHRDDIEVVIGDHAASVSASRGESRTILLSLKILELKLLEQNRDKKPILLLDDVFSELDGSRRKALTSYLKEYQTFITTTDADIVVQHFIGNCTIIPMARSAQAN